MLTHAQSTMQSKVGIHTVVINLERDKARLATVSTEFARQGMAFERFAAVEGLAVPPALRAYFFATDGHPAPTLTGDEIGCYASHLSLWRRVASGQYPSPTLICEDDIRLPGNFRALVDAALAAAPQGWDIIRLSAPTKRTIWPVREICDGHQLVHYSKIPTLLGAYLISKCGAEKLLKPGLRSRPVDLDMARPWEVDLNLFGVDPAPVYQPTRNPSSIDAVEQRRYPRRATGFFGIRSRLLGRERFARYRHNTRTVGVYRAVVAEIRNLFRGSPPRPAPGRAAERPVARPNEAFEG
jgi:glycosyl transferase, family 25